MSEEHDDTLSPRAIFASFAAMPKYSPVNWFWKITNFAGGNDIYSSAAAAYMTEDDSRYTDWLAQENSPTLILCDGELAHVLWKARASYDKIAAAGWTDWGLVPLLEAAQVIFASGVIVTSGSTPAINGTFDISPASISRINSNLNYIQAGNKTNFPPNNAPTKEWPTLGGGSVVFPNTTVFTNFAMAIVDYQAAVNDWSLYGGSTPLPPRTITIA